MTGYNTRSSSCSAIVEAGLGGNKNNKNSSHEHWEGQRPQPQHDRRQAASSSGASSSTTKHAVGRLSSVRSSHNDDDGDEEEDPSSVPLSRDCCPKKQNMQWQNRFQELCLFRETHGHCCVPYNFTENRRLAQVRVLL
jgi:hypothetical protein